MALFSKAKKAKELGKPRTEAERKKVNKRLKKKYGYEEAFGKPKVKVGSRRHSMSSDDAAEIERMRKRK